MKRARIIPALLLDDTKLVKTKNFKNSTYIGDPINAVKIFNEKEVDELILLDIQASVKNKPPDFDHIKEIVSECFMPVGYGGGIQKIEQIDRLFRIGIEKVILNSGAFSNPSLVRESADHFGSQSIVISIDVKKSFFGKYQCFVHSGKTNTKIGPVTFAKQMEQLGAGEIYLTSIDREGSMEGYDIPLIKSVSDAISIPVIANGGAGKVKDFRLAISNGNASGVSAGSMFVFHGPLRGILINFPNPKIINEKLYNYERGKE